MARVSKTTRAKARASKRRAGKTSSIPDTTAEAYRYPESTNLARPEAGQQARFRKRKPKVTYRYDSSLSPSMEWDGQNAAREHGEWLVGQGRPDEADPLLEEAAETFELLEATPWLERMKGRLEEGHEVGPVAARS